VFSKTGNSSNEHEQSGNRACSDGELGSVKLQGRLTVKKVLAVPKNGHFLVRDHFNGRNETVRKC